MTKFLASVNSLSEARLLLDIGVDIIDLKQPAAGALGALALEDVRQIVREIAEQTLVSATIGDLPMQADSVAAAVAAMAETKVDFIKIGFFPDGDWSGCLAALKPMTQQGLALVAVLFADLELELEFLSDLASAGFKGVMLDTQDKSLGSLAQLMSQSQLSAFVSKANELQLLCGLAGSLRLADVAVLKALQADYLGFRGGLCMGQQRTQQLDPAAIRAVKAALSA